MKRALLFPILALTSLAFAKADPAPAALGAAAPPLKLQQWIQGKPITDFVKGQVYVVEFWATWCGPCKVSIPHLNEMSHKYAGKANFYGVSVWENRSKGIVEPEQLPKVADFVKTMGDKMSYNIAADTPEGDMSTNWIRAYGQQGIPCAFIVDQQGRIAFVDHPMDPKFEQSLQQVIAGKFDIDKARKDMEAENAANSAAETKMAAINADMKQQMPEMVRFAKEGLTYALEADYKQLADKYNSMEPKNISIKPPVQTASLLMRYNEAVFYAYVNSQLNGTLANDSDVLNSFAWNICTAKNFQHPDYNLAVKLAERACVLTNNNPEIMDTLALAYFKSGDKAKAVYTEQAAADKVTDPATKKEFLDNVETFKKG